MTTLTPAQVLRKAADLIERDGWARCSDGDRGEPHCVEGAMRIAAYGDHFAAKKAFDRFVANGPVKYGWVWNDSVCASANEAAFTLRACADKIEREA